MVEFNLKNIITIIIYVRLGLGITVKHAMKKLETKR